MALLEHLGIVDRLVGTVGEARFELAEPFVAHHHHVVCTDCGAMADFRVPDTVEAALHQLERDAARAGFRVSGHRLDFIGTCGPCLGPRELPSTLPL